MGAACALGARLPSRTPNPGVLREPWAVRQGRWSQLRTEGMFRPLSSAVLFRDKHRSPEERRGSAGWRPHRRAARRAQGPLPAQFVWAPQQRLRQTWLSEIALPLAFVVSVVHTSGSSNRIRAPSRHELHLLALYLLPCPALSTASGTRAHWQPRVQEASPGVHQHCALR